MRPGHRILLTLVINKKRKNKKQKLQSAMLFSSGRTSFSVTCFKVNDLALYDESSLYILTKPQNHH